MAHWDDLEAEVECVADEVYLCGCLLPNEAPNSRCFILRPTDHAKKWHFSPDVLQH